MGKNRYSQTDQQKAHAQVQAAGKDLFQYSKDVIATGGTIHPTLDPAIGGIRRSMNPSDDRQTVSVSLGIDVTGSGDKVPGIVDSDLPQLMGLLQRYLGDKKHPNIQVGAIGDGGMYDKYPLQISQFESDVKIDECLRNIVLEGGGGGNGCENYELWLYAALKLNYLQCWERQEKGWMFMVGDELPYSELDHNLYNRLVVNGASDYKENKPKALTRNIPIATIVADIQKRYHVFYVICKGTRYWNDPSVTGTWKKLLGNENVVRLEDAHDISELIAGIIGCHNGMTWMEVEKDLKKLGTVEGNLNYVVAALEAYAGSADIHSKAIVPTGGSGENGKVIRL